MRAVVRSRRADILAAAGREFAASGFAGARIERIAAAAAVNKQLLFHYYGSKEGLFAAALGQLLDGIPAPGRPAGSPLAQLRQMLRELLAAVRAVPGVVGIIADARSNPEFPAAARELVARWRGRVLGQFTAALLDGQRSGHFRDDIEPADVASVALAAALGAMALDGSVAPDHRSDDLLNQLLADYCAWR